MATNYSDYVMLNAKHFGLHQIGFVMERDFLKRYYLHIKLMVCLLKFPTVKMPFKYILKIKNMFILKKLYANTIKIILVYHYQKVLI